MIFLISRNKNITVIKSLPCQSEIIAPEFSIIEIKGKKSTCFKPFSINISILPSATKQKFSALFQKF